MNKLAIAKQALLAPGELTEQHLEQILSQVTGQAIDQADLYFQTSRSEYWYLEDGIVKDGSYDIKRGVGIRAVSGEKTGFAYTDDIILPTLTQAAKSARSISQQGQQGSQIISASGHIGTIYGMDDPLSSLPESEKIVLLRAIDQAARAMDPRVQQVTASLAGSYTIVLIFSNDGRLVPDIRPLVRLNVNVIIEQNGRREEGSSGGGGRFDYHYFLKDDYYLSYVKQAVQQAVTNLAAEPAPAGMMPVVLSAGWPGVLLHEAVGHGLEGDFNRKGTSAFSGRIGERVASPGVTVVDDGTLVDRRGSLNVDDEGNPSQHNVLIENGILKMYLQDQLNARLMGVKPTGNGRRESYAHLPMPRMTNTYMLAGKYDPKEIITSVDKGIYAVNFAGGQVDITSGKFVFSANEAYLIEKGKITCPIKGATLIGNGPDVMTKISMIGNDLALDSGIGVCGKDGQSVPVGVGQPTLKIDALTVGGTK